MSSSWYANSFSSQVPMSPGKDFPLVLCELTQLTCRESWDYWGFNDLRSNLQPISFKNWWMNPTASLSLEGTILRYFPQSEFPSLLLLQCNWAPIAHSSNVSINIFLSASLHSLSYFLYILIGASCNLFFNKTLEPQAFYTMVQNNIFDHSREWGSRYLMNQGTGFKEEDIWVSLVH